MTDNQGTSNDTQIATDTAQMAAVVSPKDSQQSLQPGRKRGGWLRRVVYVLLMLLVIAGLVVAAVLLRMRLDTVLSGVDSLEAQLEDVRAELDQVEEALGQNQTALDNTQQALEDLAEANVQARGELEDRLNYYILLTQAQQVSTKSILSITEGDLGQARREIAALRATLVAAAGLAGEEDISVLVDLEQRAAQAESDLNANSFASQQTLEVVWRDLSELVAAAFGDF